MDHDVHCANPVAYVLLRNNIPSSMPGSFFSGGEEAYGQISVTLRDAIFDPSEVFDHSAQLVETLMSQ